MAINRFSQSTAQSAFPKFTNLWDGTTATSAFDSLGAVVVSSTASSVAFSSIPQTYTHLQIRFSAQDNRGTYADSELKIQFNSDTGNNYRSHYLRGNGAVEALDNGQSTRIVQSCTATLAGSNFASGVIDILDYTSTSKYKTIRIFGGFDNSSSGGIWMRTGLWMSSSAMTSVQIGSDLGSALNQYSSFALYGIK